MKGLYDYILYNFHCPPNTPVHLRHVIYGFNLELFKDSLYTVKFTLGKSLTLYQLVGITTEALCRQTSKHSSQL